MTATVKKTSPGTPRVGAPFVAFLRGVNVGGRNPIRMPNLADCFRDAGYRNVSTYLQSGNVLFSADDQKGWKLESAVERMLERRFGAQLLVVIRSLDELALTIESAPSDHGSPALRSDVMFLKHPLTARKVLQQLPELREGVDSIAPGPGAIYFSRVAAKATKTRVQRLMAMPVFQQMTVRTWRTCTGLLEKLEAARTA